MRRLLIALALTACVGGESPTEPLPERALFGPVTRIEVTVSNPTCYPYVVTHQADTILAERYTGPSEDIAETPTICGR